MKGHKLVLSLLCLTTTACQTLSLTDPTSTRPPEDVARDVNRQPEAVLDFLGITPQMHVMDVVAAGGYYTEVLSKRVGAQGRVFAQNPSRALRFADGANDRALTARLAGGRLANVRRLDREFDDLGLVAGSLDAAVSALNLHDIYNHNPDTARLLLRAVWRSLRPGGVFGVIDHVGVPDADNTRLHRLVPADAIALAEEVGFVVQRSSLLANSADDHSQGPFAPGLRGRTDRFLLKLRKPSSEY